MKNRIKKSIALCLVLFASIGNSLPAYSCAFDSQSYFTYTVHPDLPLNKYAAGQLGIIDASYARSYLLTAYRYLEDKPLNDAEQKAVVQLWNDRLKVDYEGKDSDPDVWLKARKAVPGASKIDQIETARPISKQDSWQTYCNCQTNSFITAADTLKGLITKYGAGSDNVKEWLKAQDQVFTNCGYPSWSDKPPPLAIPSALPKTAEELLQKYRDYQIAAANFYSQNFEAAKKQFEAIGADSASPLKHIAPYMVIRCMIREASLAKTLDKNLLVSAQTALKKLQEDHSYQDMSADLAKLASFIDARLDPARHVQHLMNESYTNGNLGEITKTLDSILGDDDQDQADKKHELPEALKQIDALDWLVSFKSSDDAAKKHKIERWEKTHSIPWLVAAISSAGAKDAQTNALLSAADQAEQKSAAAKWTLMYHSNRLRLEMGKKDQVRSALDQVISLPPANLPAGSLNAFRTQRLPLSKSLDEFLKFGFQTPLCNCSNGGTYEVPDDINDIVSDKKLPAEKPVFTPEAGLALQKQLPLTSLNALANNAALPAAQRNNIAWTGWVRAILVGDDAASKQLAQTAKQFNKSKAAMFDSYLSASTPEQKAFAATFLMLHFSSAQPNPAWGPLQDDSYGDSSGWWWSEHPATESITIGMGDSNDPLPEFDPLFLSAAEKNQAKQQVTKLKSVIAAPNYFAKIVLPFAQAHPDDPRVPEALHWFVKATRYGMTDDATKTYSKQAFNLLHSKYKTSPWTKKTPYFY